MRPVHHDTAGLLLELLKRKWPLDPSAIVPIAALDQYLTLDLLILANSLSVDRENSVGTVPDALERIGARAVTVLIDRLSSPDFPALPKNDPAARAVRRASLAAAVAAGRYAERYGISRERGYTLGLLHCIGYADLFEIVREMNLPAGPFRGAVLETYRPAVGRSRAEIWGLPRDFEAVLSDDGTDRAPRPPWSARPVRPCPPARSAASRSTARTTSRPTSWRPRSTCCSSTWASKPSRSTGNRRPGTPLPQVFPKIRTLRNPAAPGRVLCDGSRARSPGRARRERTDIMRFLRTATALTLCASAALSQQPPQRTEPLPTFSESVEVRVLNLDVDVTDSKGNPVTDLKREDFTLKIGKNVVPIDYFSLVNDGALHAPDLATATPEQTLSAYKKGEDSAYVPRNFLVYVDLGYLPPGYRNRSLNAIRDLATRLGPNDAMRVVVFNRSPKVLVDWTTSKENAMAALSEIESKGVGHVAPAGPDAGHGPDRRHGVGAPQRELAPDDRAPVRPGSRRRDRGP